MEINGNAINHSKLVAKKMIKNLILTLCLTSAVYSQQGGLVVYTSPDSASLFLNGTLELDKTPYINPNMVSGFHDLILEPSSKIFKKGVYRFEIENGQNKVIEHEFEYRNINFNRMNLSLLENQFRYEIGYLYQKDYKKYPGKLLGEEIEATGFLQDKEPTAFSLVQNFSYGIVQDLELHLQVPFSGGDFFMSGDTSDGGSFGLGDLRFGAKYTYRPLSSAVDLTAKFDNGPEAAKGTGYNSVKLGLITMQERWSALFLGNLSYEYRFPDSRRDSLKTGDEIVAYIQAEYPFAKWSPYLGIDAVMGFSDKGLNSQGKAVDLKNDSYLIGVRPGFLIQSSRNLSFEFALPFSVTGLNRNKNWGFQASLTYSITPRKSKKSQSSEVTAKSASVPIEAESFVIFDRYEVSNKEYRKFCDKTGRKYPRDPGFEDIQDYFTNERYEDYPVVNVSFEDAEAYASWVGKRLPTVEEWQNEFSKVTPDFRKVACDLTAPLKVQSNKQIYQLHNVFGNVSEWVVSDESNSSTETRYHAGNYFLLPRQRCIESSHYVDIAHARGAKFIGFRCVKEIK